MTSKQIKNGLIVAGAAGVAFYQRQMALAQFGVPVPSNNPSSNPKFRDVPAIINTVFTVIISAAGAIFLIMFLIGGIRYLTAAGNEEATGKARTLLVDAIVGLIIVLSAYAVGTWVLGSLGLQSESGTPFR